jgi:hypothetical protein
MLALAGVNALGLLLFLGLYVAGGLRWLSEGAFLAGIVVLVGAITALWARVEGQMAGGRGIVERIGRAMLALLFVAALGPIAVLMPLFALDTQLPTEAGVGHLTSRAMVLLLISTILVLLCNAGGAIVQAVRALRARTARTGRGG